MAVPVVPGFACKKTTRPATTGAAPPFSGLRRPRSLRVVPLSPPLPGGPASVPRATPQQSLVPPVRHHAELRARWLPPQPLHNSRTSLAPGSGHHSLSAPGVRRFHPRLRKPPPRATPARPGPCPSPAPPPAAPPPPHVTRPRRGFRLSACSGAQTISALTRGLSGPGVLSSLPPPPSGYENSKQLADLRADQLRLPPTPAFCSNPAAAASKISLRAGLGGGGDFSGRGCLRSKEPLHAHSSPPK